MNWKQRGYEHKLYHDDQGKVWGWVNKLVGKQGHTAHYNGHDLGEYIDHTSAQIAVEKAHRNRNRVTIKESHRPLDRGLPE